MKQLIPIYFLTLVNVLGFAVLIPVLPFIVKEFGHTPILYGMLIATYPLFQFVGAPVLGTLSDHFGRRPILILSQSGTLLSWILFAFSYITPHIKIGFTVAPIIVIALSRVVDGITGGNFSVANAYISDISEKNKKTKIYGIVGAIVGIGLVVGPAIGGYLMSFPIGYLAVSFFSITVSGITLLLMIRFLPESLPPSQRVETLNFHIIDEINIIAKINSFKNNILKRLFFIRIFFALSFSSYTSTIVLYMIDTFRLTPSQISKLFVLIGIFFIINQSIIVPFIAKHIGNIRTFFAGQILTVIGFSFILITKSLPPFIFAIYIANLGMSSSFPTFKSIITNLVSKKKQGLVTGIDESVLAAASVVAPLSAGIIYTYLSSFSYFVFAIYITIPFIYFYLKNKSLSITK